jgi:hypothetical protein
MSAPTTDAHGTTRWRDAEHQLHRDYDLPAVVWPNGTKFWYQHGKLHRDGDLPAIVYPNGTKFWYQHGESHQDGDLPAVVRPNGRQEWWVEGRKQSVQDREETRRKMAQAARWSPLRAAFVGVVAAVRTNA